MWLLKYQLGETRIGAINCTSFITEPFQKKSSEEMKSIFHHFETSMDLKLSHEALYERAKLFALTDEYDRALDDLKKATTMAPWDYKIR